MDFTAIKALTFDVFGTVVDWRSSLVREGQALGRARGLTVDWAQFADAWRGQYQPMLERVPVEMCVTCAVSSTSPAAQATTKVRHAARWSSMVGGSIRSQRVTSKRLCIGFAVAPRCRSWS